MGWTYGAHEGGERCLQVFGGEARREEITGKTKASVGGYH